MKWSLKMYNKIPLLLIYLIIIVFIIVIILNTNDLFPIERFSNKKKPKYVVSSFILDKQKIDELSKSNSESHTPYIGCFIPNKNTDISKGNLIKTTSLNKYNWEIIEKNSVIPNKIIIDISYTKDGRLSCIALGIFDEVPDKCNNNNQFHYYEKETEQIESKWIMKDENNMNNCKYYMRSVIYDYNNFKLLGVNSNDGQIYEKILTSNFTYSNWNGPINPDVPMKKIMFNKDDFLIGIGLIDNYIYKKTNKNWHISKWDKQNINKFKVYDLIYDKDGCLIASTNNGFFKQKYPDFIEKFEPYSDEINLEILLSPTNILKYKTGYEFLDLLFNLNKDDEKILQQLYEYKKLTKYLCKNRKNKFVNSKNNHKITKLNKQNQTINNLYKMIAQVNDSLNN